MISLRRQQLLTLCTILIATAAVIAVGTILLKAHAATSSSSIEAESGVLQQPATHIADGTASGGSAVRFGVSNYTSTASGPTKMQGFAVYGSIFAANPSAELTRMRTMFPGVNVIRVAIGTSPTNVVPSVDRATLIAAVNEAIRQIPSIQIILDDHQSYGAAQTGNTAADLALYRQWAADFKSYPQVSFNTPNEPGGDSIQITAAEKEIYTAVRSAGAPNRIWLEYGGYFPGAYQSMINSAGMTNIGMDIHLYPRSDTSSAAQDLRDAAITTTIRDAAGVPLQQAAFEFGPSLTGPPSGTYASSVNYVNEVVTAARSGQLVATTAWVWSNGGTHQGYEDLIVDRNGTIGQFGTQLQSKIFAQ